MTSPEEVDALYAKATKRAEAYQYHAQFTLQEKEPLDLDEGMELFRLLDGDKSGDLTFKEVRRGCINHRTKEVEDLLEKYKATPLGLLLEKENLDELFDHVNIDNDKVITVAEWKLFLTKLVERDLDYIREKGLATYTAYWGRVEPEKLLVTSEFTLKEWFADFWFYECNNNNLLGLFLADPNNTLKTLERLNIEFCCQSWVLTFTAIFELDPSLGDTDKFFILFLFVTIPTVLIRNILLYCFRCPCLIRRHSMSMYRSCCFPVLEFFGHMVGFMTFICALVLLIVGIILAVEAGPGFVGSFFYSWGMTYVYGFMSDMCIIFNPFRWVRHLAESSYCCCMKMMGFGKWQFQRSQVLIALVGTYSSSGVELDKV